MHADQTLLLNLVKGSVSSKLFSKLNANLPLDIDDQYNLWEALKDAAAQREPDDWEIRLDKNYHKWFYGEFQRARGYAEKMGWLKIPFEQLAQKDAEENPPIEALPFRKKINIGYHATSVNVLERIKKIGITARDPHEETGLPNNKAVFFFATYKEAVTISNSLFADNLWKTGAAILKVDIRGLPLYERSTGSLTDGREFYTGKNISPSRILAIKIIPSNFDNVVEQFLINAGLVQW